MSGPENMAALGEVIGGLLAGADPRAVAFCIVVPVLTVVGWVMIIRDLGKDRDPKCIGCDQPQSRCECEE